MGKMKVSRMIAAAAGLAAVAILALLTIPARKPLQPPAPSYWPTQSWQTITPEEAGFSSAKLAEGLAAIREKRINIHSLMLIRRDRVLLDAYFYPYDGETFHDQASVTKSVMTTLIAIAADQGKLRLDQPMVSFFPDRKIANLDTWKKRITVRHLTGNSAGLDVTAAHDEQTLHEMMASPDYVQFILDRPMLHKPGTSFEYSSPGMHLLSAILQEATGMTALEFARANLFAPLGIEDVLWEQDAQGYNHGWADLYLHPRDMAKLGFLWLHGGHWEGRQIVPRHWVEKSVERQIDAGDGDDYGYGWWVVDGELREYSAVGRGGQYIRVFPELDTIVVLTGGGFEWDEIVPLLLAAIVDEGKPLPADPEGVAKLKEAVTAVRQPPAPHPVPLLPPTARAISGQTFVFGDNPMNIAELGLVFDGSAQARMAIAFKGQPKMVFPVGLNGIYRLSPSDYDLPMGLRGSWLDERTFHLEYDRIANREGYDLSLRFERDCVILEARERTHEATIRIEGRKR